METRGSNAVLFLLGAGASVDSGMRVYRGGGGGGNGASYYNFDEDNDATNPLHASALGNDARMEAMWEHLLPIMQDARKAELHPGPTYERIKAIASTYTHCMVATQNVDAIVHQVYSYDDIVELHGSLGSAKCLSCESEFVLQRVHIVRCPKCDGWLRPRIVLFGESLDVANVQRVHKFINDHHPSTVYVVGTSMRFPYLHGFVKKAKSRGACIVHVNPDPDYKWHMQKEQWYMDMWNEPRCRVVKKKRPETLVREL